MLLPLFAIVTAGNGQKQQKQQEASSAVSRTLQENVNKPAAAMELVSQNPTDKTVTVRLRQSLFGSPDRCGSSKKIPEDVALTMFAVYKSPEVLGQPYCNFYYYQPDACFTDDIIVACDPETNSATVELIVRETYHLNRFDRVTNPRVKHFTGGMCVGPRDMVGNTVSMEMTFECKPDTDVELDEFGFVVPDVPCDTDEACPSDKWCSPRYDLPLFFEDDSTPWDYYLRHSCRAYAADGGQCYLDFESEPAPEEKLNRCAPAGTYGDTFLGAECGDNCNHDFNLGWSTCRTILGSCTFRLQDCNDPKKEYCTP